MTAGMTESRSTGRAEGAVDVAVYDRFFKDRRGTLLEVGAARPDWLSIGATYRQLGWDVLAVEPNPHFAEMHRAIGQEVAEVALSDKDENGVPFTVVDCRGALYRDGRVSFESWSSLGVRGRYADLNVPSTRRTIAVRTCRADTLLAERRPAWGLVDLVTVDVEGWELDVLAGLDFERYRPKVLIIENLFCDEDYRRFMAERGYALWRIAFPNEVYVRTELLSRRERFVASALAAGPTAAHRGRAAATQLYRQVCRRLAR